ncbi:hypothetical protein Bca4012_057013 [Brassica carinata]
MSLLRHNQANHRGRVQRTTCPFFFLVFWVCDIFIWVSNEQDQWIWREQISLGCRVVVRLALVSRVICIPATVNATLSTNLLSTEP